MLGIGVREGESVYLTTADSKDVIRVKLLKTTKGRISLGIDAPDRFEVYREKLWRRLQRAESAEVTESMEDRSNGNGV